jgi:hypothetical protein
MSGGMLPHMWAELSSHCEAGRCALHSGSKLDSLRNSTDCKGRLLAYELGLSLIPERAPQREVFDALELEATCGVTPPVAASRAVFLSQPIPVVSTAPHTFYVAADAPEGGDGSESQPMRSIHTALDASRHRPPGSAAALLLRPGIHFLGERLQLGEADSGLTITPGIRSTRAMCGCQAEGFWIPPGRNPVMTAG